MEAVVSRPCLWTLPSTLKTLYISDFDHGDKSVRQAALQLISDAAERSDNVGIDEFTEDWFDLLDQYMDVAVLLYKTCDELPQPQQQHQQQHLVGLIVITESRFCRTPHPKACQLFVVTSAELSGRLVWRDLTRLGVALAMQSSTTQGYIDCFIEVFVLCLEHVLAMRDEGFAITACIPTAGLLKGHTEHVDSFIMYKQLRAFDIHSLSLTSFVGRQSDDDDDDVNDDVDKLSFTLRELPDYLPCRCDIDGGRTQITVRPLRRDEVADFYATIKAAATSGNGYGYDELSGLAYFVRWYVDDLYNAVFELTADKQAPTTADKVVIGYTNFGPCLYTRSRKQPAIFDGNIVLRPQFRGRGWIRDLNAIRTGLVVDLGIHSFFEDAAVVNVPATRSLRRTGAVVCGTIPRYVYIRDFGYVDGVLYYKLLDESHSFRLNHAIVKSKINNCV